MTASPVFERITGTHKYNASVLIVFDLFGVPVNVCGIYTFPFSLNNSVVARRLIVSCDMMLGLKSIVWCDFIVVAPVCPSYLCLGVV